MCQCDQCVNYLVLIYPFIFISILIRVNVSSNTILVTFFENEIKKQISYLDCIFGSLDEAFSVVKFDIIDLELLGISFNNT